MKIVFATNNPNKVNEIQNLLPENIQLLSLKDIGFNGKIPEDFETLEENAIQKAQFIYDRFKTPCFADDTGLEVESLNGKPGVYSARYAGNHCSAEDNMIKLLKELKDKENRNAKFRTVIAFITPEKKFIFEGFVNGSILVAKKGEKGFGYDPVFQPEGYSKSFAQMPLTEKNKISHRANAVKKFVDFLEKYKIN